jgi:hypothetical protein
MSTDRSIPAPSAQCRTLPTPEALAYLEQHGGSINRLRGTRAIPSNCATGYPLANGEIVLLENGLRDTSPALIFSTAAAFDACCRADQFPLPPAYLTWGQIHLAAVGHFLTEPAVYALPLRAGVQVEAPFATRMALEGAYTRVRTYLRRKSVPWETREPVAYAFALAVAQFCVAQGGYACVLHRRHHLFNPYYEPCLRQLNESSNVERPVFGKVLAVIKAGYKVPFDEFLWFVTGISPVEQARNKLDKE